MVSRMTLHRLSFLSRSLACFKPLCHSLAAAVGDVVTFTLYVTFFTYCHTRSRTESPYASVAKNHSVTQSSFANPCVTLTTPTAGIDSGFLPVNVTTATSFPQWSFTVQNASAPLWFYCAQPT